ncbi:MAG: HD domain-containing protein [Firmicutes bacterium]|nr:HD domain-containing protein [Bacillota bacterium]
MVQESLLGLKVIREFARFLHGSWERDIVLIELLHIFDEIIGCSQASAYLFENGNFELKAKLGEPLMLDSPEVLNAGEKYITFFNCQTNVCESILLNDRDLLLIPLIGDNEVFGLILYKQANPTQALTDLVSVLGTLASVSFKNASLAEEKKMIDAAVSAFASGLDMQIYYPQFAEKLKQIFPFDRLTITLPDPFDKKKLLIFSLETDVPYSRHYPFAGSAPAWVMSTGKPIIEDDLAIARSFPEDDLLAGEGIRCALRVPLNSKGKTIGSLNIGSRLPGIYKQKQIELFAAVARRIGPAVENALVYETINQKLSDALVRLENNFSATLNALTVLLDSRDAGTKGHSLRVVRYASVVAENLGLQGKNLEDIRLGSLLHDIGKIGIPDSILFKPGRLDDHEWSIMKSHPGLGAEMVSKIEFLSSATPIVLHHHEWFNGGGYPDGLAGEKIPLGARIFSIADAFDAMTSDRPYRKALSIERAVKELKASRGTQFCPSCVDAFTEIPFGELASIFEMCQDEVTFKSPYLISHEVNAETATNLTR